MRTVLNIPCDIRAVPIEYKQSIVQAGLSTGKPAFAKFDFGEGMAEG